ncbi:histidine phosphatase family protein [Phaeobacter sp.]|uniref:histidine phosphatase family protein n=1 Tax=Phaeobacter sp. TaxID=1902409 RepID=UPI0025D12F88|nr:histidine phosphatase family protein [Phaeobacter sp.]
MIKLALIRHGHTDWNRAGKIQGRSDIPLDADARSELAAKQLPAPWSDAALWSSPLQRAYETAQLIGDRDPQTSEALIEMNWGDWEGQHGKTLRADPSSGFRDIEDWGWHYRPPQGESPQEVWDRLVPWIGQLREDTVAVCHIGIMRMILAKAHGWDFAEPAPFAIKRNRMFVVEVDGDTLTPWPEPVRLQKRAQT